MNEAEKIAIAEFMRDGGRVNKVEDFTPATEQEVLAYLAKLGIEAKYLAGGARPYVCENRRVSRDELLSRANKQRRLEMLKPFAFRF